MNVRTIELLADAIDDEVAEAAVGHCLRVDDLESSDAESLAHLLAARHLPERVQVAVLERQKSHNLGVTVEQAVGIRNDKDRVLVLLVSSRMAHAASSLDNSFERLALLDLLQSVASTLEGELQTDQPELPLASLRRQRPRAATIERWIDYLSAVADDADPEAFGKNLWRIGLVPHKDDPAAVRESLSDNSRLVQNIATPSRVTATVRERLQQAGVTPGKIFDAIVDRLNDFAGGLHDSVAWTKELDDLDSITFGDIPMGEPERSALASIDVQSFRNSVGKLEATSKLRETEEGALYCQTSDDNPGTVGVRWKTNPASVADIGKWLLELLPPEDLRTSDTEPLVEMKVAAGRRSAILKVDITPDDVAGGALFVVRVTALDSSGVAVETVNGGIGLGESDQFEVVFVDEPQERSLRQMSVASIPEAFMRATLSGASSLDMDMPTWDLQGQVFGIRVGKLYASQVRVSRLIVGLERRIISDPRITAFRATSPYGQEVLPDTCEAEVSEIPPALAKKRRAVMSMLKEASPRDVPEVFQWDDGSRSIVEDYLQSFRRALDAADAESKAVLQRLDTLELKVGSAKGEERALIVLPTHPLRLAWMSSHHGVLIGWARELLDTLPAAKSRQLVVDMRLVERVAPTNLPFAIQSSARDPFIYFDEVAYGSAVMLLPGLSTPEATADAVFGALGVPRESRAVRAAADLVERRIAMFREAHPTARALRIAVVNPGSAEILGRAVRPIVLPHGADEENLLASAPPRVEVIAYGEIDNYVRPLASLSKLQADLQLAQTPGKPTHLMPPLGLASRPFDRIVTDEESHHIALVQDIATQKVGQAGADGLSRLAVFHDLLTPLITVRTDGGGAVEWSSSPALKASGSSLGSDVVDAHFTHQRAVGEVMGFDGPIALAVTVQPEHLLALRAGHQRADWVLTLDKFVGLDLYEDPLSVGLGPESFILDYAPDFIDGLSHRLTVTTAHRAEVEAILERAMNDLGLAAVEESITPVLESLMTISGRLILRLQRSENFARESVSLAALMAHLRRRGELADTIIVPVDSHDEIFGRSSRDPEQSARRCDLLLVRVTSRALRIECVEVKSRKDAALPMQLADDIVDQLEETKRLLVSRFFATDPSRVDATLQRAKLAGLLHYYADRAATNGLIEGGRLNEMHRNIDKVLESNAGVELTMKGYVISLHGVAGVPKKHREVPINVLTAADLGHAGFSTKFDESHAVAKEPVPDEVAVEPELLDGYVCRFPGKALEGREPRESDPISAGVEAAGQRADSSRSETPAEAVKPPSSVEVVLGSDSNGAAVGWTISTKGSPHAFILGIPGQGKSVTTRRIVRSFDKHGLPSLLFDFHGDMAADPPEGATVLDASAGLPFGPFEPIVNDGANVNLASWEIAEIIAYVAKLGEIQRGNVYKALQTAYVEAIEAAESGPAAPTVQQFAQHLERAEEAARGRNARDRVRPLTDFGLFADAPVEDFDPRSSGMVVDLSGLGLEQVQLAAGAFLLRKIYREMFGWEQDGTLKLAIVLDEAHRLSGDVTLPKLMKEGRKYGVVVVVASQGTADFHKDVLGNAGTKIVFRTNYPASRAVAGFLRGRSGQDLSEQIEKLGVGQAYVSTADSPQARKVQMSE